SKRDWSSDVCSSDLGQTECKRVSIMPEGRMDKIMAGSCGLPLTGTRVWLDQPDENGVGELIVSGPNVMGGYLNAGEVTAEYFFRSEERRVGKEGGVW